MEKALKRPRSSLMRKIVMSKPSSIPSKWNVGAWLDLLELCSLVLQLGNGHKKEAVGFEDTGHLIHQSSDLSHASMIDHLDERGSASRKTHPQKAADQRYRPAPDQLPVPLLSRRCRVVARAVAALSIPVRPRNSRSSEMEHTWRADSPHPRSSSV